MNAAEKSEAYASYAGAMREIAGTLKLCSNDELLEILDTCSSLPTPSLCAAYIVSHEEIGDVSGAAFATMCVTAVLMTELNSRYGITT